ncbi:ketopantoate reductase family protein [Phaeovulum sp.]|uniref:ketopantoate reductase family protein n=1 Tax=Phaeovulum sp. TaxID=2934796 RepID=UPI002731AF42|nr:2-dehydropantoate 2-reductase [Phaeovulum sp.]MDP1668195.1 2-dehydropantoate 2-reductase [Phaeovulum sp.]MDZ4118044.1 2-dehydropantoate 2-reductase [Phaeovulum sp.]
MDIAVLGAGSLGSVIGGRLAQSGHAVTLINRNPTYVEAVNRDGLILDEARRRDVIRVPARLTPEGLGPVELVIVLVKSFHTEESIRAARGLLGPQTTVMSLQNGLGQEDILARVIGAEHVVAGKTYVGGVMTASGVVSAGTTDKETIIGELSGAVTTRVCAIANAFETAGLACSTTDNIRGAMWDKLLVNVATGALAGITRLNYGNLYDIPELAQTAIEAVAEAMDVAALLGVGLKTTDPRQAWEKAAEGLAFTFKASILQSLENGSRTEIDFINGAVARAGRQLGFPTPVNDTLVACIKGLERALDPKMEGQAA